MSQAKIKEYRRAASAALLKMAALAALFAALAAGVFWGGMATPFTPNFYVFWLCVIVGASVMAGAIVNAFCHQLEAFRSARRDIWFLEHPPTYSRPASREKGTGLGAVLAAPLLVLSFLWAASQPERDPDDDL
jgi:hypothetical protein